jgi:hypothetical protein
MSYDPVSRAKDTSAPVRNDEAQFASALDTAKTASQNDGKITVVDLNSAMGLGHNDKNTVDNPDGGKEGLDFNNADMNQAIDDLFGNGRDPDIITMQEVALKGAVGTPAGTPDIGKLKGIQQRLEERTGDTWKVYVNAGPDDINKQPQYYRAEPGRVDGEGIKSSAGTVIFVREGPGSDVKTSNAIFPVTRHTENGVTYENVIPDVDGDGKNDSPGGSLVGVHVITKEGNKGIDIYTSHTTNVKDSVSQHNKEVDYARDQIRQHSGNGPVIWTGDFNADMSRALLDVTRKDGFRDASWRVGATASKVPFIGYLYHYDHIFTRGIHHDTLWGLMQVYPEAKAFEAPSSDHKGLVITVDPKKDIPG